MKENRQSAKWLIIGSLTALVAGAAFEIFYYPLLQGMGSQTFWWMTGILSSVFFLLSAVALAGCSLLAMQALLPGRMKEPIHRILGALFFFILWLLISTYTLGLILGGAVFLAALAVKKKWGISAALICAAMCIFLITGNRGARLTEEMRFRLEGDRFCEAAAAIENGSLSVITLSGESAVRLEGEYARLSRDTVDGVSYAGVRKDGDSTVILFFWYRKDYEYMAFAYVYEGDGQYTVLDKRNFEAEALGDGWYLYNTLVDND